MSYETFFTADTHFGHAGIIEMCGRPFGSIEEMDEALIERWNATVGKNDTVWHLGDFALKANAERIKEVFFRLNGRKHLVLGNHDRAKTSVLPWASFPKDRVYLRHDGEKLPIVLDHYSMRSWPKSHYGAVHLYGHSHGALPGLGRSIDVGVDCWDYRPVTLAELRPVLDRQHEEFERQRDAVRMMRERAARGDPEAALEIVRRAPDVAPETGEELRDLREGDYDQALEVGLRTVLFKPRPDPLGYDTSHPGYLRTMAEDALAGRNEEAVDAEADRAARVLGLRTTRVVSDPAVLGGEPHVSGTTVPARVVLAAIRDGSLDFEITAAFPSLPRDAVHAVREWAAGQKAPGET